MKNRNIPYGYSYENGEIVVDPKASIIILEIFHSYIGGKSLGYLSKNLSERHIEYTDGVSDWNKARIKRIIEDERYLGKNGFPQLISIELYAKIQKLREGKNTKKHIDTNADIYQVSIPVRCPKCNGVMIRRYERRCKRKERWICQNGECHTVIVKSDSELIEDLTALLKRIKYNPEIIQIQPEKEYEESVALRTLNNEIVQRLDAIDIDEKKIQQLMLEYASQKYAELDSSNVKTQRLKDIFKVAMIDERIPTDLLNMAVKEITLDLDGEMGVVLINNQKISKEKRDGEYSDRTS